MGCKFTTWKVIDRKSLFWEQWDNDYIVFNELSGETHLLNELAAEALRILETQPMNEAELAKRLSSIFGVETIEVLSHMPRLLEEFDNFGLIEPSYQ